MLTINKTWAFQQACSIQNNKRYDLPKMQILTRDTVSFSGSRKYVSDAVLQAAKKAEQETGRNFFKGLRELCEHAEFSDLAGEVEADARILAERFHQKAHSLLDLIANDSGTNQLLKQTARELKDSIGNPL